MPALHCEQKAKSLLPEDTVPSGDLHGLEGAAPCNQVPCKLLDESWAQESCTQVGWSTIHTGPEGGRSEEDQHGTGL